MKPVVASDSSHTLEELLSQPSAESWRAIVEMGKLARKNPGPPDPLTLPELLASNSLWGLFCRTILAALKRWPPEIERLCPASWPADFRAAVEHQVRETDTYGHYLAKICGHPDLRLSDGSQAVWLERRFTGGIVELSTVKSALRLLASAQTASSVKTANDRVKDVVRLLAGGTRNVGKVGCADLTGGLTLQLRCRECANCKQGYTAKDCILVRQDPHGAARCIEVRLEVEVKVGDEPQRPEQVARMESVRRRGGCYVLANSVESAVSQIQAFISSH